MINESTTLEAQVVCGCGWNGRWDELVDKSVVLYFLGHGWSEIVCPQCKLDRWEAK